MATREDLDSESGSDKDDPDEDAKVAVGLVATVTVGTKGVLKLYHLCFDDNKVLKLSIGYAKSLFKCTRPLSKIYS